MDILNKNQNLETLFDYNRENKSYQDYLEYLNLYYKNPTKNDKYDSIGSATKFEVTVNMPFPFNETLISIDLHRSLFTSYSFVN